MILIIIAIVETVLQLSFVAIYFKTGLTIFKYKVKVLTGEVNMFAFERLTKVLKSNSEPKSFKFEEIETNIIAFRLRVPLSSFYGVLIYDDQEKVVVQKLNVAWLSVVFLLLLSIITFMQSLFYGLLSVLVFPFIIYLQFLIVKEKYKTIARIAAGV